MWFYFILVIACLFLIHILFYDWFSRNARLMRKIPGPQAWPIIGNSLNYILPPEKQFQFLQSLHTNYGHINQIHCMNIGVVHISNPEDIGIILSSPQYLVKSDFYLFAKPWLGDGLLLSNGEKWHHRRKLLTRAFHFDILKKFMVTFKEESEEFLKQVDEDKEKDKTDLLALVRPTTLRIICETAMGVSLREDKDAFNKYFNSAEIIGEAMMMRFAKVWLHNDFIFNLSDVAKTQKFVLTHLHGFTNKVIDRKRKSLDGTNLKQEYDNSLLYGSNEKMALLNLLLQNEKLGLIDNEGIREEVDTFMFEGYDTTSTALSFFLMAIANEPVIQDKIYKELLGVFGDSHRPPTMNEANELKYLECCIKESMRLYPSVPIIARMLSSDTVLSGYTVPAGTNCLVMIFNMHRRADLFPDPERFDPDRFLPENNVDRNVYSYIPFSAGVRNCIGQKFAMLEMKMILAPLLRRFRLEPVTKTSELVFTANVILRTKEPMYARLRLRN